MHQINNAPFMIKNVNFTLFAWTLLGHSEKITDLKWGLSFLIYLLHVCEDPK